MRTVLHPLLDQLDYDDAVRIRALGGRAHAIVESTLTPASSLQLRVVAEGVETEQERSVLAAIGGHLAQGYLFGRPVPADELWVDGLALPGKLTSSPGEPVAPPTAREAPA